MKSFLVTLVMTAVCLTILFAGQWSLHNHALFLRWQVVEYDLDCEDIQWWSATLKDSGRYWESSLVDDYYMKECKQ